MTERYSSLARRLVSAHFKARPAVGDDVDVPSTLGQSMLRERHIQSLIGEAFARSYPEFRPLFAKVQESLHVFLAKYSFAADRNIKMLVRFVKLPPPEEALVRLAAAFCYTSIKRSLFAFVDFPSRIVNAVEQLCSIPGALLRA